MYAVTLRAAERCLSCKHARVSSACCARRACTLVSPAALRGRQTVSDGAKVEHSQLDSSEFLFQPVYFKAFRVVEAQERVNGESVTILANNYRLYFKV